MNSLFSWRNSWDLLAIAVAVLALASAGYQFVIGKHYMIPTMILFWCVLFGNLARHGLRGATWAKHLLYWFGFLMSCMAFMGIFMAQAPKERLGAAFVPVAVLVFLAVAFLTWRYREANDLAL